MAVFSDVVCEKIDEYWSMMVEQKSLDIIPNAIRESQSKARRHIDVDTLEHTDACDIGAEWLCLQAVRQLKFEGYLRSMGWTEEEVKISIAHTVKQIKNTDR